MTVVGSSKFSRCEDGNSKRRIRFSWPKKFCNSGVFLRRQACRSTSSQLGILEKKSQKLQIRKEGKTHSNERCILAVLSCLFDEVMANHKVTSFKTTDSAILHNWPIQFDN